MSWYYVDQGGNTQGPLNLNAMKQAYQQGKLKDQSFVWNGADVNQWTPLNKVPKLLQQVKPQNIPKPQSRNTSSPPRRKSPFGGGGGRSALLAGIRGGAKLRKAPKPQEKKVGETAPKKPGQKLSLQEQMALTLRRRNKGGGNKTSKVAPKRNISAPKKTYNAPKTNNSSTQRKPWSQRQNNNISKTTSNSSNHSTGNSRIDNITRKLKNAQDWQLKAIEKLLS